MTLFAPDSIWNAPIGDNPQIDPDSEQIIANMLSSMGPAQMGRNSMAFYEVPADQPTVAVEIDAKGRPDTAPKMIELVEAFQAVPIPDYAEPVGGDQSLVVRQGDRVWEMERYDPSAQTCTWAGYIDDVTTHPGYYRNVYRTEQDAQHHRNAVERDIWGVSAAGFPAYAGMVTVAELLAGQIDHAIRLLVPYARQGVHSFPAQRQDGLSQNPYAVVEGSCLQLDPAFDCSTLPFPLNLIGAAGQVRGIRVCDQTHDGTIFWLQSEQSAGASYPPFPAKGLASQFPWDRLRVLQMDLRSKPDGTPVILTPPTS